AHYRWPGNVRELANIVERLTILHGGSDVSLADLRAVLPVEREGTPTGSSAIIDHKATGELLDRPLAEALDGFERRLISGALAQSDGNVAEAARRLQTDRPNLYRRMRRLGIEWGEG
ncbi:MAG: hypothetical protein M3373_04320, partial [Gemmatimonadota bacterium]|nr:hypothetical protein [Gemmatimonadota bacterium]